VTAATRRLSRYVHPAWVAALLTFLVLLAVYHTWPVLFGTYLAFTEYNVISPPRFVGLANFQRLLHDDQFWSGVVNSLKYLMVVPVLQLASIGLAMLVNRPLPGIGFFRTAYYVPVVTSVSLAAVMFEWIFNREGVLNWMLITLHLSTPQQATGYLNSRTWAFFAVMLVTFWRGFGYYMVLYLAGLQGVPKDQEEAAEMDGATRLQVFWHVTLPALRPTVLVCSLLSTISAIKVFEEVYVMTSGGPVGSTYTALFFTYAKAFQDFQYGYAAAAGLVIAVISLIFGAINFRLTRGGRSDA